jgi:D-threo-aldose 1-dehydrogenase
MTHPSVLPRKTVVTRGGAHLSLTSLGLGTAPLGNLYRPVSDADVDATFEAAWAGGIRLFDTAPFYGRGLAETRLNRFLRGHPRDDYVLSTKVGRLMKRIPAAAMTGHTRYFDTPARDVIYDYSRDGILRSVEHSLERLGVERFDILLVHDIDPITHGSAEASAAHVRVLKDSGMRAFDELRSAGVVRAIGTGLNVSETTTELVGALDLDFVLLAGRYTLLEQGAMTKLLPLCIKRRTHVLAAGVFNSGLLAGGATYNYQSAPQDLIKRASLICDICRAHGISVTDAALQFPARHPAVAAVLFGAVTAREVRSNIIGLSAKIPTALWDELKAAGLLAKAAVV